MEHAQTTFAFEGETFGVRTWGVSSLEGSLSFGGAAPVVLLHGFAQSAASWERVARLAADRAAFMCALDLPGHGASGTSGAPAHENAFDLRFQARAVNALCRHVAERAGAAPVLAGYSMGGRVALEAARLAVAAGGANASAGPVASAGRAGRAGSVDPVASAGPVDFAALASSADPVAIPFSALVLESAGLGPESDAQRAALRDRNFAWAQRLRCEGVESFMDYWETLSLFESQKRLPDPVRARLRKERLANSAESLALTFERAGAHAMPAREDSLHTLKMLAYQGVTVLYLAGELDAKYRAVLDGLAHDAAGAVKTRIVAGAGHNVHLERPEAFAREVAEILGDACAAAVSGAKSRLSQ